MTTIVYRNGVLAADSRSTMNGTIMPGTTMKVGKNKSGWLYGASGNVADIIRFQEWASAYDGDGRRNGPPGGNYSGVVISPQGVIFSVEGGSVWPMTDAPFIALGSGADVAYGALDMDAGAERAVEAACRRDAGSGLPVRTVTLN